MNFSQSFLLGRVTDCLCLMQTSGNKNCEKPAPVSIGTTQHYPLFNDFFHIRKIHFPPPLSPRCSEVHLQLPAVSK